MSSSFHLRVVKQAIRSHKVESMRIKLPAHIMLKHFQDVFRLNQHAKLQSPGLS